MSKSVYLSPSVQENNIGIGNYGTEEKRMNEITDVVEVILKEYNITVYRNNPIWGLSEIVRHSNEKSPNIHVAIHSNANDKKSRGCEVFCHKFGGQGEKLSKLIYDSVSDLTPSSDRGVKEGFDFYGTSKHMYELAKTNCPASLVEIAFHDNKEDAKWIIENIEKIGISIANGILKHLNFIPYHSNEEKTIFERYEDLEKENEINKNTIENLKEENLILKANFIEIMEDNKIYRKELEEIIEKYEDEETRLVKIVKKAREYGRMLYNNRKK